MLAFFIAEIACHLMPRVTGRDRYKTYPKKRRSLDAFRLGSRAEPRR